VATGESPNDSLRKGANQKSQAESQRGEDLVVTTGGWLVLISTPKKTRKGNAPPRGSSPSVFCRQNHRRSPSFRPRRQVGLQDL
jgi:hypothetical protein